MGQPFAVAVAAGGLVLATAVVATSVIRRITGSDD